MKTKPRCVLDASALIAWIIGEAGKEKVRPYVRSAAAISAINMAEVLYELAPEKVLDDLRARGVYPSALDVVPFDLAQAAELANLHDLTRPAGLSLADQACCALARLLGVRILAADEPIVRAAEKVALGVEVIDIRPPQVRAFRRQKLAEEERARQKRKK